ncbi:Os01g0170400 [Oryza sativa Japonica Group]|uniref:Os01g0170400 protein n=1 Tax=Oryza sativa subsp. japonica TaxID=39947 RepID=Q0JQC4_ORYSJ|nr:Os01g0170400 [Oryza sativa Japonica Group]|eukprot:NP_001042140.2 Os01g0170400 [Oryza sativa Japonica Group]
MGDTDETVACEINHTQSQDTETGVSTTGVVDASKDKEEQQQSKDGEKVDEESRKRKPMALRSDVWESFSKVKLANGDERAKCKRTITRACVKVYEDEKEKLKKFFKDNCGHRGEDIGKSLENCLAEWGIDKVFTITVDNASANNNAIKYMRRVLNESKGCVAEGEYIHMRCAAHIINLIVGDGLKEIGTSIQRVRAAVKFIRCGTSRLVKFKKCAELAKVQSKAFLNLDICTRWNSTYLMLNAAEKYQKAFERYSDEDPYYKLELEGENGPGVPTRADWEKARKMADFLEHFYDLTLRVSVQSRTTSHTYFHEIADVLLLLREWSHSEDKLSKEMGTRMLMKYYKYWGEKYGERQGDREKRGEKDKGDQLLNFTVFFCVAIDPRYKLSNCIRMGIKVMFGDTVGEKVWETVNTYFRALFEEYKEMYTPKDKAPQPTESESTAETSKRVSCRWMSVITQQLNSEGGSGTIKSEVDKYLSEDNEPDTPKFDILKWWKANSTRFPILSHLARDLLAIPITSVASESAFSAGGRTLDDFRTSLTPRMVERLVCANDWLRGGNYVSVEEDSEQMALLEEGRPSGCRPDDKVAENEKDALPNAGKRGTQSQCRSTKRSFHCNKIGKLPNVQGMQADAVERCISSQAESDGYCACFKGLQRMYQGGLSMSF